VVQIITSTENNPRLGPARRSGCPETFEPGRHSANDLASNSCPRGGANVRRGVVLTSGEPGQLALECRPRGGGVEVRGGGDHTPGDPGQLARCGGVALRGGGVEARDSG